MILKLRDGPFPIARLAGEFDPRMAMALKTLLN